MKTRFGFFAAVALASMVAPMVIADHLEFNGARSYSPANVYGAPVFRQFAFVEGILTQYHVVMPEAIPIDNHESYIVQFPNCQTLTPVLEKHVAKPGDGGALGEHDAPTRRIVDAVLTTGCAIQPKSLAEVQALAFPGVPVTDVTPFGVTMFVRPLWVNVVVIPERFADYSDTRLFNGPPFRPRVPAWQEGKPVVFITYETSWDPTWVGTNFPAHDADVFIISYEAVFRRGFTILNVAAGTPRHWVNTPDPGQIPPQVPQVPPQLVGTVPKYSPIWAANCIVDAVNQKCGISVNMQVPGYFQCKSVAECLSMVNANTQRQVVQVKANTFTHIDCPMVAVDMDQNDYIEPWEELRFPNVWVDGPVIL